MGAWIPHVAGAVRARGRVLMGSATFRARCLAIAGQLLIVAAGATTGVSLGKAPRPDTCTTEPASSAVAIAPGTPGSIFVAVADNCGLVTSSDSGVTWTGNDPSGGSNSRTTDVKARVVGGQVHLDVCGEGGF